VTDRPNSPHSIVIAALLCKNYKVFEAEIEVLKYVNMTAEEGSFSVISGPSGSGKTTLLNMIGGIDRPTSGKIIVFDEDLSNKDEDFLASFRCAKVGHVFQSYNLISTLTVTENVAFPMEWLKRSSTEIEEHVHELLEMVGLSNRAEHFPYQLSGGEQQRVAFARALANDPPLLLVDEPTGNLDEKTSTQIVQILQGLKAKKKTIVVSTHDAKIIELGDQRLWLEDGKLMNRNE
jgi:putative ABC transport system ATP-binding protein